MGDSRKRTPIVGSRLVADLRGLGVRPGAVLMVHARLGSIGAVIGTSQAVVEALLEVVGAEGTLLAYTGWDDNCFHLREQPDAYQHAVRAELPGFDPLRSRARRQCGPLAERLRTWPGALRSDHPEASFTAVGRRAEWLLADQSRQDPYGTHSPLGKLVQADGQVLLLGAPIDQITLFHHAEAIAQVPVKRRVQYEMPVRRGDTVRWEAFDDIDTSDGAFPYAEVLGCDAPTFFARAVDDGRLTTRNGLVGYAVSRLFDAALFTRFACDWMESTFGAVRSSTEAAPLQAGPHECAAGELAADHLAVSRVSKVNLAPGTPDDA